MMIRCPQCQYANHVEADATKPRIICARCATVISVEFHANPSVPPVVEVSREGQNPTERLFMKTPESPLDLDSLLNTPVEAAPGQPTPVPATVLDSPVVQTPAQVSENHWDHEEILDIPRATSLSGQNADNPLTIDDLLGTTPLSGEVLEPYAEYPQTEIAPVPELDLLRAGTATFGAAVASSAHDEAADDVLADYPVNEDQGDFANAGLDETAAQEDTPFAPPRPSVFAQDSYVRSAGSTYVMATPDQNNKGRLAKVFLAAALGFALLGVGYFALSGLVKDWLGVRKQQIASGSPAPVASVAPTSAPSLAPSQTASSSTKTASPTVAASASPLATVAASVKPSATPTAAAATPTPKATTTPNQTAAAKPTPIPAPAKTGTSGHSVGASDGSLAIQVASFKSPGEAQQAASRLKSAGVEARVVKADVPGMGTRFRVQAGRFTNETEASKYAGELRAKGVARDFIVTGYQNQ